MNPSAKSPHGRRATRADVARLAGVSGPVVSAVVNGPNSHSNVGASAETRERVWAAVRELGYTPNRVAQRLAGGRNRVISVFTYDPVFPAESENFYHEFFVGIEQEADAQGYNLMLMTSSRDEAGKRAIYVDGRNSLQIADGAVILGGHHATSELGQLVHDEFPFVHVGRREVPGAEISWVAVDYADCARSATQRLIDAGHHRIAFASTELPGDAAKERQVGFLAAVADAGLDNILTPILPSRRGNLLDLVLEHQATAVVLETLTEARALYRSASEHGLEIPADMSLVSLGGLATARPGPQISGLAIPRRAMGRQAVQTLIRLVEDPTVAPLQSMLDPEEEFETTLAPPRRS